MATKISISKALEKKLRGALGTKGASLGDDACDVLRDLVKLLDASLSKASDSGLPVSKFIAALEAHRPVVKPPPGKIADQVYARLAKALRDNGVTQEHAEALGLWLVGQAWIRELTLHRLITNLSEWVTRAVASRPTWERPEW